MARALRMGCACLPRTRWRGATPAPRSTHSSIQNFEILLLNQRRGVGVALGEELDTVFELLVATARLLLQ